MRRVLVTGANRGIGLLLSRLYGERSDTTVFATCRNPDEAADLRSLSAETDGAVRVLPLDVGDYRSILSCADLLKAEKVTGLDVLINNAGVLPGGVASRDPSSSCFGSMSAEAMIEVFRINTVAPVIVTQVFAALLRRGDQPRVVNVSSDAGSFAKVGDGCSYAYPASKAALNMMTRCMSGDLKTAGVIVAAVHPGFVRTDMGGPGAHMEPEETVPSLVKVIDGLSMEESGGFYNWDGRAIAW